jgi:hypothetical protein
MVIQVGAGLLLLALLWALLRFALGLRWQKLSRERTRSGAEAQGRRVVAEIPLAGGELTFFQEDAEAFYWAGQTVRMAELSGARLVLNGAVLGSVGRPGVARIDPRPDEPDGRERWDVLLELRSGATVRVPCGTFREGVSREIAGQVFEAVRQAVAPPGSDAAKEAIHEEPLKVIGE